jgi:hypothetical protein
VRERANSVQRAITQQRNTQYGFPRGGPTRCYQRSRIWCFHEPEGCCQGLGRSSKLTPAQAPRICSTRAQSIKWGPRGADSLLYPLLQPFSSIVDFSVIVCTAQLLGSTASSTPSSGSTILLRTDLKLVCAPSARYRPTPCLRVSTFILPAGRFARVTMAIRSHCALLKQYSAPFCFLCCSLTAHRLHIASAVTKSSKPTNALPSDKQANQVGSD